MLRFAVALCLVSLALAGPPVSRTREEIEEYKNFLENSRTGEAIIRQNDQGAEWEYSGKFEGDIILDDEQIEAMVEEYATGNNAYIIANSRWPQNTVIYQWTAGVFTTSQRNQIVAAMRDIEQRTCIRFRERRNESAFVRMTNQNNGCYANVGYRATRGAHTFNLANNCFRHAIIVHEWLHIIGFFHMQSTHNRDDYVRVQWENIQRGMEHNFDRYSANQVSNLGLPYEYISNLHYFATAFSINGRPTLVALRPHDGVMGQQNFITDLDYLRVNRHYNCPGAWEVETENN